LGKGLRPAKVRRTRKTTPAKRDETPLLLAKGCPIDKGHFSTLGGEDGWIQGKKNRPYNYHLKPWEIRNKKGPEIGISEKKPGISPKASAVKIGGKGILSGGGVGLHPWTLRFNGRGGTYYTRPSTAKTAPCFIPQGVRGSTIRKTEAITPKN